MLVKMGFIFPNFGVKINNIWNHHLEFDPISSKWSHLIDHEPPKELIFIFETSKGSVFGGFFWGSNFTPLEDSGISSHLKCYLLSWHKQNFYPIASMYGVFTYIYHKNQPENVGKYTSHMDSTGTKKRVFTTFFQQSCPRLPHHDLSSIDFRLVLRRDL